ncbi:MAG: metallophosphoesterase family protein [Clostridia bacterium]|nr:metallophosphoesterase family protein [Clostridia bacterium]
MKKRTLRFNENGKFKILVITDLHEKQANGNKETEKKTHDALLLVETSIKALSPDLVVYDGDNAFGIEEDVRKTIDDITRVVRERNIPFAVVMGNHEHDDSSYDIGKVFDMYAQYDNCLIRNDDKTVSGYGNYYIALKGRSNKTKALLFFIDSGASRSENQDISAYDWVKDDQIEWFETVTDSFREKNGGEYVPALVFQHMPVTEIYNLLKEVSFTEGMDAIKGHSMFSSKYYVLKDGVKGSLLEPPCPPDFNNGQFSSWKTHGVKGAFFGHDHTNDFEGELDGILLAQCKGTGFNGYSDGIKTGVKLITVEEDNLPEFKTRDYYFTDFGLKSKSIIMPDKIMTYDQKKTAKKIGAGVAAATAAVATVGSIIRKIIKDK